MFDRQDRCHSMFIAPRQSAVMNYLHFSTQGFLIIAEVDRTYSHPEFMLSHLATSRNSKPLVG
ncbi:MAG: hypothetical protein JWO13_3293 [Acidobacteriales bacterium]|nr:hypothetical protein [Terriglobales bacterium]